MHTQAKIATDDIKVIHQLIDYGVATSTRSSNLKDRLSSLGLVKDEHFDLQDVLQVRPQGGTVIKKVYMLTPEAFFLALQRAQRRPDQTNTSFFVI